MSTKFNRIIRQDCVGGMKELPAGSVDLVFADPPFNIGYKYSEYSDTKTRDEYLTWSRQWLSQVKRVLKSSGTFWLAIGDEFAAELKVLATQELGFCCRSWVIWYYTFGVHCHSKFARSHAHLFHFVRDRDNFVFNTEAIRVPSARQLVYADKRADPRGRVPDDTWIVRPTPESSWLLRPQDLPEGFSAEGDTWYFPRVCGTFRERSGFHGCQMPEQLLGRIIRVSSNSDDLVLDPFSGSGTTLVVAKKLDRRYLGYEISKDYVDQSRRRLASAKRGAMLEGSARPLSSVASTRQALARNTALNGKRHRTTTAPRQPMLNGTSRRKSTTISGLDETSRTIVRAYEETANGYSSDRVLAEPALSAAFISRCEQLSIPGDPLSWNRKLLQLRKSSRLSSVRPTKRTTLPVELINQCEFASEIAFGRIREEHAAVSLDDVFCSPELARRFDKFAHQIGGGSEPFHYRWAAIGLRKRAHRSRNDAKAVARRMRAKEFSRFFGLDLAGSKVVSDGPALYMLKRRRQILYVGETGNLETWVRERQTNGSFRAISRMARDDVLLAYLTVEYVDLFARRGAQSFQIGLQRPLWNYPCLAA